MGERGGPLWKGGALSLILAALRLVQFVVGFSSQETELGSVVAMIPAEGYHRHRSGHPFPTFHHPAKAVWAAFSQPAEEFVAEIVKRHNFRRRGCCPGQQIALFVFSLVLDAGKRLVNVAVLASTDFSLSQGAQHAAEVAHKGRAVSHILCARVTAAVARLQPRQDREERVLQEVLAGGVEHTEVREATIRELFELLPLVRGQLSDEIHQSPFELLCLFHSNVFRRRFSERIVPRRHRFEPPEEIAYE